MTSIVGILLAGGESRRFGSPKAFAEADGELFYERAFKALAGACDQVIIISRSELLLRFPPECDVITDLEWIAGKGPLAGILSGMIARPAEKYMVLPCDMPFIGASETIRLLAAADGFSDISAVRSANGKIPLFSVWNSRVKEQLQQELKAGQFRVMEFMGKVTTEWIDSSQIHMDPLIFRNMNQPDN